MSRMEYAGGAISSLARVASTRGEPRCNLELWDDLGAPCGSGRIQPVYGESPISRLPSRAIVLASRAKYEIDPRTLLVDQLAEAVLAGRPDDAPATDGLAIPGVRRGSATTRHNRSLRRPSESGLDGHDMIPEPVGIVMYDTLAARSTITVVSNSQLTRAAAPRRWAKKTRPPHASSCLATGIDATGRLLAEIARLLRLVEQRLGLVNLDEPDGLV